MQEINNKILDNSSSNLLGIKFDKDGNIVVDSITNVEQCEVLEEPEINNEVITRDGDTVQGNVLRASENSIVVDDEVKFRANNITFDSNDSIVNK